MPWYKLHLSQQGQMEKLLMVNMRSSLATLCRERSSKKVVLLIQRVTCSGCAEGQIKARKQPTPLALRLPKLSVQHYHVILKATYVFLQLRTPVVFNISFMERTIHAMNWSNSLAFLSPFWLALWLLMSNTWKSRDLWNTNTLTCQRQILFVFYAALWQLHVHIGTT